MNCDTARIYCGAVADGETGMVPEGVLAHVAACHDCSTEVQWQRQAQAALVGSLAEVTAAGTLPRVIAPPRWWRRGPALAAVAAAAAMLVVAGTTLLRTAAPGAPARPAAETAMSEAAHAYGRPAAFSSTDPAAISGWSAGRGLPIDVVALPGEVPTGARVATIQGHVMVTVIYAGSRGSTEVTTIPARVSGGWPSMEAMKVDRVPVGMVHTVSDCVIVVTPDDGALHTVMTALQAA